MVQPFIFLQTLCPVEFFAPKTKLVELVMQRTDAEVSTRRTHNRDGFRVQRPLPRDSIGLCKSMKQFFIYMAVYFHESLSPAYRFAS